MDLDDPNDIVIYLDESILSRLSNLLSSEEYSDVVFKVGKDQQQKFFRAHKLILSTASNVFKAMLYGPLSEGDKPIEVPDLQPDGFYTMLRFVYEDCTEFDSVFNAINTLTAAKKYEIKDLAYVCCSFLALKMAPQNACVIFETALLFKEEELEREAVTALIHKTEEVIKDESFLQAKRDTLEFILRQSPLGVSSELQLFEAVLRWGQANVMKPETSTIGYGADIGAVLNPLLPFIRFLSMSREEFNDGPGKSEVLKEEEMASLLMNITSPGSVPPPVWVSTKPPRKSLKDSLITQTFCSLDKHSFSSEKSAETDISVEGADILLCGITVLIHKSDSWPSFKFKFHNLTRDYKFSHEQMQDGKDDTCSIILINPVLVRHGETCRIKIIFPYVQHGIGLCPKMDSAEVINGAKVHQMSSRILVHEIKYYTMDRVLQ